MSRRRKNAGEGYGYMFHGAFAEKADAVAKERKTPGAWVKGTMTKSGWRYLVMSPRTNPRRVRRTTAAEADRYLLYEFSREWANATPAQRKRLAKKAERMRKISGRPAENPAGNPSELLVLGANPSQTRELNLPAGSTITIRVNPTENICGASIGGYPCTRKPGHRGPHLPQGATMRPTSRLRHNWKPKRRNPSAEAIREDFTGAPADGYTVHNIEGMPAGEYAQLGELLSLYVKPLIGGQVREIRFSAPRPLLVSDTTARQLYFVGGDQDVTNGLNLFNPVIQSAGLVELGEVRRIDYKQRKAHVPDPDIDEWKHNFGEESGVKPSLWFDRHSRQLFLKGGEYVVRREGIVN